MSLSGFVGLVEACGGAFRFRIRDRQAKAGQLRKLVRESKWPNEPSGKPNEVQLTLAAQEIYGRPCEWPEVAALLHLKDGSGLIDQFLEVRGRVLNYEAVQGFFWVEGWDTEAKRRKRSRKARWWVFASIVLIWAASSQASFYWRSGGLSIVEMLRVLPFSLAGLLALVVSWFETTNLFRGQKIMGAQAKSGETDAGASGAGDTLEYPDSSQPPNRTGLSLPDNKIA